MNRTINRAKLFFLGLFVICGAVTWGYELLYVIPQRQCEARGHWWDGRDRACAIPMPISTWTGRIAPTPAGAGSATKAPASR